MNSIDRLYYAQMLQKEAGMLGAFKGLGSAAMKGLGGLGKGLAKGIGMTGAAGIHKPPALGSNLVKPLAQRP